MDIWRNAETAKSYGCTHKARIFGVIPGFFNPETRMWVSRSDLLNPVEDLFGMIYQFVAMASGVVDADPFVVGSEIK